MAIVPFTDPARRALVGQQVNAEEWNTFSRVATNTDTTPIGMGQPVQRVAGSNRGVEAWDGTSDVAGVTVWTIYADTVTGFAEGSEVPVASMGILGVAAGDDCTAGAPAGYDPATDRWADVAGDFVNVPGVEFDTNAGAGAIVEIRVNRPAAAVAPAP